MNAIEFVKKYGQERVFNFIKNPRKLDSDTEFLFNYSRTQFNPIQLKQDEFEYDEFAELDENEWYWVPRCFDKNDEDIIENDFASVVDLKQIVDAFELVESYGSIDDAKNYLDNLRLDSKTELEQALNLVEQCNA